MKEIQISLSEEQTKAFDTLTENNNVYRVLYGGQAGGGKSFLICLWIIYMAELYPETRYYIARRVLKDIRESILLTFFDVCKQLNIRFRYHDKTIITFPNGSTIYLVECENIPSDPNFDRLGSKEYTAGAIEEGIDVSQKAANILMSRTRYKHDIYNLERKQLITCNPGEGWIKEEIVQPYFENRLNKKTLFVQATLQSNPNKQFAEQYKDNLEELPQYEKARLLHGDWNARPKTGGEFLKDFKREVQVSNNALYNPNLALHLSFDENVNPYLTCIVFQIHKIQSGGKTTTKVYQIDEICLPDPRNTRRALCQEIQKRYFDHTSGIFIYGDATSQKSDTGKEKGENFFTDILNYLRTYNPNKRVPKSNPNVITSKDFVNHIFYKQNELAPYQNIEFYVNDQCDKSINDYLYCLEDSDGTLKKQKVKNSVTGVTYEKDGHITDAMRYFMTYAFKNEYNKFKNGGRNPSYASLPDNNFSYIR